MLNLDEINNTIEELENGTTTFDTCIKLASLYTVQEHLQESEQLKVQEVEQELNDILPQYRLYCEAKRKYQMHESSESAIQYAMENMCKEINEFIHILYNSTETVQERESIKRLITDLYRAF